VALDALRQLIAAAGAHHLRAAPLAGARLALDVIQPYVVPRGTVAVAPGRVGMLAAVAAAPGCQERRAQLA